VTSRFRRAGLGLLAIAALVGLIVGVVVLVGVLRPSGIPETPVDQAADETTFACPSPCDRYAIAFAGDTMIGSAASKRIRKHGYEYVFQRVPKTLARADYTIVNAEAPISTLNEQYDPDRKWSYATRPAAAKAMSDHGIDAVGFANNHTFDRGLEGIEQTWTLGPKNGLAVFGGGRDRDQAEAPLMISTPHGTVGIVGIESRTRVGHEATPEHAGTPRLRRETVRRQYERAVAMGADWVVAYVHWGANYWNLLPNQKRFAKVFAEEGYDLVIGHGPHVIQGVGRFGTMPVVYSLGNFIFNTPGRFKHFEQPGYGLIATAYLGPDGFEGLELDCIQADNQQTRYRVSRCKKEERVDAFARLGGLVQVRRHLGVVTW